jgi:hypothetical protein
VLAAEVRTLFRFRLSRQCPTDFMGDHCPEHQCYRVADELPSDGKAATIRLRAGPTTDQDEVITGPPHRARALGALGVIPSSAQTMTPQLMGVLADTFRRESDRQAWLR